MAKEVGTGVEGVAISTSRRGKSQIPNPKSQTNSKSKIRNLEPKAWNLEPETWNARESRSPPDLRNI